MYVTARELGEELSVATSTVRRWIDEGLPYFVGPQGEKLLTLKSAELWLESEDACDDEDDDQDGECTEDCPACAEDEADEEDADSEDEEDEEEDEEDEEDED